MSAVSPIVMPKLGLTMTEGLIASWNVKPGDTVRTGDLLFVVETEKISTEIESQGDGRIETIEAPAGDTVPVGAVVATWVGSSGSLQQRDDHVTESLPRAFEAAAVMTPRPGEPTRIVATPLARRLAREAKVSLDSVTGSGPRGRIKARDVEAAIAAGARGAEASTTPAPIADTARVSRGVAVRRPATNHEKTVARRLTQAKQEIPHFYVQAEVDVGRLLSLREELNSKEGAVRISVNQLIVAAVGRALVKMPEMNSIWDGDAFLQLEGSDVGVAVDTELGLFAPIIRNVASMGIDTLAKATSDIASRAKSGKLRAEELSGGAVTVSNVGMFGAAFLFPIINPGQSAILGVAGLKDVFRPDGDGKPRLAREIGLVLACDHRVTNGVRGAQFVDVIAKLLENPIQLLRA